MRSGRIGFVFVLTLVAQTALGSGPLGPFDGDQPPTHDAAPTGVSYLTFDHWGGDWCDAEKSPVNTEDDSMCWAAAAANVLEWTGWGRVGGMTDSDQMFQHFQVHWSDQGGLMRYGWEWWFNGTNTTQGLPGWSQVDVPGGGEFWPAEDFHGEHYHQQNTDSFALAAIDSYAHAGYGIGLGVYGPGGHAITCWGYNCNPDDPTDYYGIWVTDSDDDKSGASPPDRLRYYEVVYSSGRWYLQDFYGRDDWYIGMVQGLGRLPEPGTISALSVGAALALLRRRRRAGGARARSA